MRIRLVLSGALGAWIAVSLAMFFVATQNFRSVDRLLAGPAAAAGGNIQALGQPQARMLLRYLASEMNRFYFERWEMAQLVLLLSLALLWRKALPGDRIGLGLLIFALALVLTERLYLTPEIIRFGRGIDFSPEPSGERTMFWRLHGAYSTAEVVKVAISAWLSCRSGRPGQ